MDFLKDNLDYLVFGTLGLMNFLVLWFATERYFYYRSIKLKGFHHLETLKIALTHRLTIISTIAVNAPYIGLLGTILGILLTFYEMGQGGKIEVSSIMLGLALALKATAAGLFVAIPAIIFYNGLLRKVDVLIAEWKQIQSGVNTDETL